MPSYNSFFTGVPKPHWRSNDGEGKSWVICINPLNGIQRNLTGSNILLVSSTKFVFFGLIGKTRWLPWLWIGWDIVDFSSETAEQNSMKLDRNQGLNVLFFGLIGKQGGCLGLRLAETFSTSPLKLLRFLVKLGMWKISWKVKNVEDFMLSQESVPFLVTFGMRKISG